MAKLAWSFVWTNYRPRLIRGRMPLVTRPVPAPATPARTRPGAVTVILNPPLFTCGYCGRAKYSGVHHRACPLHEEHERGRAA